MAAADYSRRLHRYEAVHLRSRQALLSGFRSTKWLGDLLALIEADYMATCTGAASGVATKYLARKEARVAAIIGTGGQARTQLESHGRRSKAPIGASLRREAPSARSFARDVERLGFP